MIKCLFCNIEKEENYFKSANGGKPNVVCIKCTKSNSRKSIAEKIVINPGNGCLLWPEAGRGADYYNQIRRNLYGDPKSELKYLHVNCNEACLNNDHIFRFKTNSAPYWFRFGLKKEIDFNNISDSEMAILKKHILSQSEISTNGCWLFGSPRKKNSMCFDTYHIDSKKLSYEVFYGKITYNRFSISKKCGTVNCINPEHLELIKNSSKSFWSRNLLKKPESGFGYCHNTSCDEFGIQISLNLIKEIKGMGLCQKCFDTKSERAKTMKAEYDLIYCEENNEKIKARTKKWSKTEAGRLSQLSSSHNRRRKGVERIDKSFVSNIVKNYNTCCYCDRTEAEIPDNSELSTKFEIEHIIPIMGKEEIGDHSNSNLEYACWQCNSSKKNNQTADWLKKLEKKVLVADKNKDRKALYELIIKNLSKPGNFIGDKFIARHMRNK